MERYRKDDQYYIDQYDRSTIRMLKELEEKERAERWHPPLDYPGAEQLYREAISSALGQFHKTAVHFARNRQQFIRERMATDERKDLLVRTHPVPKNIRCKSCNSVMLMETHMFQKDDTELLFVFGCPKSHSPRRAIYSNGEEYFFPQRTCDKCGSTNIKSSTEDKDELLIFKDTCKDCGEISVLELEKGPQDSELPISEEDRKKYIFDFTNRKTFEEDLLAITEFIDKHNISLEEKKEKETYDYDKIKILTVPQIEAQLSKLSEEHGFIKFSFTKTDIGRHVVIDFSLQDPTDRKSSESEKIITKAIKKNIKLTNWRLMSAGIVYRLGILTGQLKAYESEDDILKLAKQLKNSEKLED